MRRAKLLISIVAILAVPGSLFGAYILGRFVFLAPDICSSSSPAGTYTVTLTGQAERPAFPAVVHTVNFHVVKHGQSLITEKYFHSGDWLDPSFSILYQNQTWLSENILHFYREEYFRRGSAGTALITNTSARTIKYLKVVSDNAYLLFDLQPGSTTRITISPARGNLLYISVEGEFSDSVRIEKVGEDFIVQRETPGPVDYYINVGGMLPSIESPHFEKYRNH